MTRLDHLIYAVGDLEEGRRWLAERTGVQAAFGGAHPGKGTHNALASLGDAYLELIAPDPDQPDPDGPRPFGVGDRVEQGLVAFAVRTEPGESIEAVVRRLADVGHDPGPIHSLSRTRPDGTELHWRNTLPRAEDGRAVPFVIDWGATPMPNSTAPGGLELAALTIRHPAPDQLGPIYDALGLDLAVEPGDVSTVTATLRGPDGAVTLEPPA